MQRMLTLMVAVLLSSCATSHLRKKELLTINDDTMSRARGTSNVKLLPHQLVPIDYLLRHSELKGILINHYMGTGKTFLSLGFAESFSPHPVVILAPKFLESHWRSQMKEYGIDHRKRFTFIAYEEAYERLLDVNLHDHLILADEVHNLVKYMRSKDTEANLKYTEVYNKLRTAYKIIGLTGTPIFDDESDLAFLANLVSGQDLMPFNQEAFRLEYTRIIPTRQFFRGYFTESNLMISALPWFVTIFMLPLTGPLIACAVGIPLGVLGPVVINSSLETSTYKLREFNVEKLKPFMNTYVSYFRFDESKFVDFPGQDFKVMEIPYNREQYSFFLRLVEGDLPIEQLKRLLYGSQSNYTDEFIKINSSRLHEEVYSEIGAGRDIGNFDFLVDGKTIEPPKFVGVLEMLKAHDEKTVIYSNYYETGILAFRDFLVRNNYQQDFAIIEPNQSVAEINNTVDKYNSGQINLLLLHPDITEGISLKGTQYLHILEPILNSTVLEQVVGRTRRFQSHSHLAKDKQIVHVRMWQSTSSSWNLPLSDIYRANWYKRYRELAYLARWGIGVAQVDKNLDKKALNPEELAMIKLKTLERNLHRMQRLLANESIENYYAKTVP